jgi:hypothetical protein
MPGQDVVYAALKRVPPELRRTERGHKHREWTSRGWDKRNLQIVLHTTVINGSPNHPDVIVTHYW